MFNSLAFALALVFVAVSAQTPPVISDDFTSHCVLDIVDRAGHRHLDGTWWFDKTGKRERLDAIVGGLGTVKTWRLWNGTGTNGGTEYLDDAEFKFCRHHPFYTPLYGVFDFLPKTTPNGECGHTNKKWSFHDGNIDLDVCVAADGKTPIYVDVRNIHATTKVDFTTFAPGRPDATKFALPSSC